MTSAEILRQDKLLAAWWVSVVHDLRFDMVVALVRAKLTEHPLEREQMSGVNRCLEELRTITDGPENPGEFPSPGLIHKSPTAPL